MRTKIYNLIILDESGSMSDVWQQTISGCNETINTIKAAMEKFADTQQHYVSIYAFQSDSHIPSRYLIKNEDGEKVRHITADDYKPYGMTPLYDAVGATLVDLKATVSGEEKAIGSVTIITDGYENSSRHYTQEKVAKMIEGLKELGWNFNFIGANIDVEAVGSALNIDNRMAFENSQEGTSKMFVRERMGRMAYYQAIDVEMDIAAPSGTFAERMSRASKGYFSRGKKDQREYTPENIKKLKPNEVFVFGSNLAGAHGGGAARVAHERFGAVLGQGVGLQGQSYAIPTMQGGVDTIRPYVDQFIEFATQHPELKFYVTRIGCGIAGFRDEDIAPLFEAALHMDNVVLPQSFVKVIEKSFTL